VVASSDRLRALVSAGIALSAELSLEADRELEAAHRTLITRHLEKELKSVKVLKGLR